MSRAGAFGPWSRRPYRPGDERDPAVIVVRPGGMAPTGHRVYAASTYRRSRPPADGLPDTADHPPPTRPSPAGARPPVR